MVNYDSISCPADLTVPLLTEMLQPHYPGILIESITMIPVSSAILSRVVELEIAVSSRESLPPATIALIAKFLKPSLPLSEMFRVEGAFYRERPAAASAFAIPACIACGPRFVLLERVPNVRTHALLESCPRRRVRTLVRRMARMHAHFWKNDSGSNSDASRYEDLLSKLSRSAGIGSALTGTQKQDLFAKQFPSFCNDEYQDLCQTLNQLDLQVLHDRVHAFQPTMIHGDFHVGNLLFPASSQEDSIYLIDWATCGAGNPLVDFTFFFVVSTCGISVQTVQDEWLPLYHDELGKGNVTVDLHELQRHFINCLLNQFVILVCYDATTRGLVQQEAAAAAELSHEQQEQQVQMYNRHFDNVNHRCAAAIAQSGAAHRADLPSRESATDNGLIGTALPAEPQLLTEL